MAVDESGAKRPKLSLLKRLLYSRLPFFALGVVIGLYLAAFLRDNWALQPLSYAGLFKLLSYVAWPLLILSLSLLFKSEIKDFIDAIKTLKLPGGAEIEARDRRARADIRTAVDLLPQDERQSLETFRKEVTN
ncbi:MAG: hypothetical protein U0R49_04720 [Fimbriimonadales bacterium]